MTLSKAHPRARQRWLLLAVFTLLLTTVGAAVVLGVHTIDQFELDKNAADDPAGGADDWNNVYAETSADGDEVGDDDKCVALGAVECAFVNDGVGSSIFTGGSTKDHLPIEGWLHSAGSVPDKTEILNAYAAKYLVGDDQVLYFGADRFAVNGSTDFGFWFFRSPVAANLDGTFSGTHVGSLTQPGDFLVLGTFTNGGAATNIRVFRWVGAGGNESGTIQSDATFGDCTAVPTGVFDNGCATVNNGLIPVAWPYAPKSGPAGSIPAGGLLEGGINLSALGLDGCFSSFVAETRSSPSITAVLKDFVLGSFETCGSTLTTTPSDANGTPIPAGGASITTAGSIEVQDGATLTVNGIDTWSGTMHFWLCKIDTGVCDGETNVGTEILPAVSVDQDTDPILSSPATITSAGRYCWRGFFDSNTVGLPDAEDSDLEAECFIVNPVTPTLTTNATAAVELGTPISDTASLSGTANQPGSPLIEPTTPGAAAGGSITFNAYGPNDPTCTGTPAFSPALVPVSGDGTAYGSGTFTPTEAGTYRWVASYSGNGPNTNPASAVCNAANETSIVVDAQIDLDPLTATNEVGDPHTITATVQQDEGTGFEAAPDGTLVTFSLLNNTADAVFTGDPAVSTCLTLAGECSVSITTNTAGSVDIHATTTFDIGTVEVTRATGTGGLNSADANKLYVDAQIDLDPLTATNGITEDHVITATVQQDDGLAATDGGDGVTGWAPAPNGTVVQFSLPELGNTAGAILVDDGVDSDGDSINGNDCVVAGGAGTCFVTINSDTAGDVVIHASVMFSVGGETLTRATGTGGSNSADAQKTYVDATLYWLKHDQDGALLGGATFEVCRTHDLDTSGETPAMVEITPEPMCELVEDNSSPDADSADGSFRLDDIALGTYTIAETAAPDGYEFDPNDVYTVVLDLDNLDNEAEADDVNNVFVNTRLFKLIIFTCNQVTNELVVSSVDLDGDPKDTFAAVPASLFDLGVTEDLLCGVTDGATYENLVADDYVPTITIPKGTTTLTIE